LIGWSLGGMLAIEQWMNGFKNPDEYSIHSLIIIASSLRFANSNRLLGWPERVIERMQKQLQQDKQMTLQQFAGSMFSELDSQSTAFVTLKDTLTACAHATDFTPAGLEAGLTYLQNTDLIARWNEFQKQRTSSPFLWLHGAEDSICPFAGMPHLNSAEVFVFQETGHIPFLTKPEIFYEKVRSFVYADRSHIAQ
jgi:pimeloyl-[acyl-carrier protein] methyl ester esterase